MMQLYDIHSHGIENMASAIINIGTDACLLRNDGLFSAGIHPWNVNPDSLEQDLQRLGIMLENPRVIAVGECGMDSLKGPELGIQEHAFVAQALLAEEKGLPMILHVVKQIDSIIRIRKDIRPSHPWLIHGFRGGPQQMRQLLDSGFWLSFGIQANSASLAAVPDDRLVLETDGKCSIGSVWEKVASVRNTTVEDVKRISMKAAIDFLGGCLPL